MAQAKGSKAPKKRVSTVPADESKGAKFLRLGKQRTGKALKAINQLRALAGNGYESTEEQRKQVVDALQAAVTGVKEAFAGKKETAAAFDFTAPKA